MTYNVAHHLYSVFNPQLQYSNNLLYGKQTRYKQEKELNQNIFHGPLSHSGSLNAKHDNES